MLSVRSYICAIPFMGHFGKGKSVGSVTDRGWEEGLVLEEWPEGASGMKQLCNLTVGVVMYVFKFIELCTK